MPTFTPEGDSSPLPCLEAYLTAPPSLGSQAFPLQEKSRQLGQTPRRAGERLWIGALFSLSPAHPFHLCTVWYIPFQVETKVGGEEKLPITAVRVSEGGGRGRAQVRERERETGRRGAGSLEERAGARACGACAGGGKRAGWAGLTPSGASGRAGRASWLARAFLRVSLSLLSPSAASVRESKRSAAAAGQGRDGLAGVGWRLPSASPVLSGMYRGAAAEREPGLYGRC